MWEQFKTYLFIDVKLRETTKNISNLKSRFKTLMAYFETQEFNRDNFNLFIASEKDKGYSTSHLNNLIKIAKHYDKFKNINCLEDYSFFHEKYEDKDPLSEVEVLKLANVRFPYQRLKKERNRRDFIVINFLFDTGCRIGELQHLLWSDVHESPIPNVTFRDTKTGDDRTIPISENLFNLIQELPHYGLRVFESRLGKEYCSSEFNMMIKRRADLAKITKPVHAHIFRHSRITNLSHYPPSVLMRYFGHKRFETTMKYIHAQLQELSVLAYSSPFGQSGIPQSIQGELLRDFAKKILTKNQYVNIEYTKGMTRIEIVGS